MNFNCEMLEKIEVGSIFYKRLGEDKLEFKETVLVYDNVIFTGSTYKSMHVEEGNSNFKTIVGVYGSRLFDPNSFDSEPDKETFYILLEKNLHPSHSFRMEELIKENFSTQDKSEFVDLLSELILKDLRHRITVNKNYDYVMYIDEKHNNKSFKLIQRENSKDVEITNSIEDYEKQDKHWRSLNTREAEDLIKEFAINFVEHLEFSDNELKIKDKSANIETQSTVLRKYREVSNEKKKESLKSNDEENVSNNKLSSIQIIDKVKSKIVSQDKVIRKLIPALLSNSRLVNYGDSDLIQTEKTNILLIGPTGVGKTAIISETAKHLGIPMAKAAATNFSGVGYADSSLSEILYSLLIAANKDIELAQKGIVFFDEVDKLFNSSLKIRDGIVDELLSWISGTTIQIKVQGMTLDFDTSLLTFIFGGAFSSIFNNNIERHIGFGERNTVPKKKSIETTDLIKYGVKDEFAGRIGLVLELNPLRDFNSLKDILVTSLISPIRNTKKYFKVFHNIDLEYDEELIDEITSRALENKTGARGLTYEVTKIRTKLLEAVEYGYIKENSKVKLTIEMLSDDYTFENGNSRQLKIN